MENLMKNYSKLRLKKLRSTKTHTFSLIESAALLHKIYPGYPNYPVIVHGVTHEKL
jgi:hypothetical protein